MTEWELKVVFQDGKIDRILNTDTPARLTEKKDDIFKKGHEFKTGKTHYYYPASSVLRAEITSHEKI